MPVHAEQYAKIAVADSFMWRRSIEQIIKTRQTESFNLEQNISAYELTQFGKNNERSESTINGLNIKLRYSAYPATMLYVEK